MQSQPRQLKSRRSRQLQRLHRQRLHRQQCLRPRQPAAELLPSLVSLLLNQELCQIHHCLLNILDVKNHLLEGVLRSVCELRAAEEMAALVADFPEYDESLLKGMVEDQGGDFLETRAVLRVSVLPGHCSLRRQCCIQALP